MQGIALRPPIIVDHVVRTCPRATKAVIPTAYLRGSHFPCLVTPRGVSYFPEWLTRSEPGVPEMKAILIIVFSLFVLGSCVTQQGLVVAVAQERDLRGVTEPLSTTRSTKSGTAGGVLDRNNSSPSLTGERHPQYRLCKSDVVIISFSFAPEFDQTVTVQPDGFIDLRRVCV
jgi:hypothetical protein